VVASAFGYFAPDLVANIWSSAKERLDPREAGRLYHECAAEFGRRAFAGIEGLDAFCAAAERVVAAAHPAGLSLFAAWAAEPLVDDLPGRSMQLLNVLREHRGSAHLVAVVSVGLAPALAHAAKRPDMVKAFGYGEELEVSDEHHALLAEAEVVTDRIVVPAYATLTEDEAAALLRGVEAAEAAMAA
jgi:Helix-turn-helix family